MATPTSEGPPRGSGRYKNIPITRPDVIVEPDTISADRKPQTSYGKVLKQMIEGDGTLLKELADKVKGAKNIAYSWPLPGVIFGKVDKDEAIRAIEKGQTLEDETEIYWGLLVQKSNSDDTLLTATITMIKKDEKESWIELSNTLTKMNIDIPQRGMFDERLTHAYWFKEGDDGNGNRVVAHKDIGVKKGDVLDHYKRFLVRLWAHKCSDASFPPRNGSTSEMHRSTASRQGDNEDEINESRPRKKTGTGKDSSQASRPAKSNGQHARSNDDEDEAGPTKRNKTRQAASTQPPEADDEDDEEERLCTKYGWKTNIEWWFAYDRRDEKLKFEDLEDRAITSKIQRGFVEIDSSGDQNALHPGPAPDRTTLRNAWVNAETAGHPRCHLTETFHVWNIATAKGIPMSKITFVNLAPPIREPKGPSEQQKTQGNHTALESSKTKTGMPEPGVASVTEKTDALSLSNNRVRSRPKRTPAEHKKMGLFAIHEEYLRNKAETVRLRELRDNPST